MVVLTYEKAMRKPYAILDESDDKEGSNTPVSYFFAILDNTNPKYRDVYA